MDETMLKEIEGYFSDKVKKFGPTNKGVDWNSEESQVVRFEQLTKILRHDSNEHFSICDYGCGYGYYSEYLEKQGYRFDYSGIDITPKMIEYANNKYGMKNNVKFIYSSELEDTYDYIVASGVFNVRQKISDEEWTSYIIENLTKFHEHSKKGFAFNCLTKYSDLDRMKDYLYYGDPLFYFDYAKKRFSHNVAILHDYDLYEFTLLVRK